jgi:ADP-heptose:LPS heptosyltransferase
LNTTVEWKNPQNGQSGTIKMDKPIVVCPEGVDTSVFYPMSAEEVDFSRFDFETPFNFLCVGQWGKGGFGEDRKNIALTVKYFIESFRGQKDVGLVLKVNMARNSTSDFNAVVNKLKQIKDNYKPEEVPPIYLLHGNLTDMEMNLLYNHPKIDGLLSLTHGEGFGRPLLEAAMVGLPVLVTNWSGHLDFLKNGKFISFDYNLKDIPEVAVWENILIKGSRWAEVQEDDVKKKLKKYSQASSLPKQWASDLKQAIENKYNVKETKKIFVDAVKQALLKNVTATASKSPVEYLQSFVDTPSDFNILYTMPMSTGDVFISTAVLDGLKKEVPEGAKVYFATQPKYKDLLKNNPNVYQVIDWQDWMVNIDILEHVFDLVLTPNVSTQYNFSNWVRRGQGRLLAEEFANHCHSELGEYFIEQQVVDGLPEFYMTLHTTSGQGQWEGRKYVDWQEVVNNLKNLYSNLKIVQVGGADEPLLNGIDIDLRGKTNYQELAYVVANSKLHLSPDTFTMHLAAALNVPLVALFGCSYATSTGPWVKEKEKAKYILLQSERKSGCMHKACYKNRCAVNPEGNGPINEISPREVFNSCELLLKQYEESAESVNV